MIDLIADSNFILGLIDKKDKWNQTSIQLRDALKDTSFGYGYEALFRTKHASLYDYVFCVILCFFVALDGPVYVCRANIFRHRIHILCRSQVSCLIELTNVSRALKHTP